MAETPRTVINLRKENDNLQKSLDAQILTDDTKANYQQDMVFFLIDINTIIFYVYISLANLLVIFICWKNAFTRWIIFVIWIALNAYPFIIDTVIISLYRLFVYTWSMITGQVYVLT